MARDPLSRLLAVRRYALEQARNALGECLAAETPIQQRINIIDEATRRNREVSLTPEESLGFMEMFANRRLADIAAREQCIVELTAVQAATAQAREAVTAARTAMEIVQTLIDERNASAGAELQRKTQHALDDMTRSRSSVAAEPLR